MRLIYGALARAWHRARMAYWLACAREDRRRRRLRMPSGVWFCGACERFVWDLDAFVAHNRAHAG